MLHIVQTTPGFGSERVVYCCFDYLFKFLHLECELLLVLNMKFISLLNSRIFSTAFLFILF